MFSRLMTLILAGAGAVGALAQSFNIDINATSSWGAGVPADAYGAAAGQQGAWNDINASSPVTSTLKNLDGTNSSATFTRSTVGTIQSFFDMNTSTTWDKLCADAQRSTSGDMHFSFNNLASGTYAVYTYAVTAGSTQRATVQVTGSSSWTTQYVGEDPANDALLPGDTYALHIVNLPAGGSLPITVVGSGTFGLGTIGGIQLKKIDSDRIRFYVDHNGAATTQDGSSWAKAYVDLQTPLEYAPVIGAGDVEIWVKQGFYEPTTSLNRSISFVIPSGLYMYGGFAGTESTLDERVYPQPTYLDGNIGASGNSDDSYHVVVADNTGTDTILDGFYIVRGNASGDDSHGGGMHIEGGSLLVRRCSFSTNRSSLDGAAVYCYNSNAKFLDCTFYNNSAVNGAGGAAHVSTGGTPWFVNCEFLGNDAIGDGGAIHVLFTSMTAVNCVFSGNLASFGNAGAIYHAGITGDVATLVNCTISENNAPNSTCGGVYANKGVGSGVPTVNIDNCILWGNTAGSPSSTAGAQRSSGGGAIISVGFTTIEGLSANPLFIDADGANNIVGDFDDNLRLQANSPCIDAGDNGALLFDVGDLDEDGLTLETTPVDLDHHARRFDIPSVPNTGAGTSPIIDRGAFELAFKKGDMNCDGVVDFFDIDPLVLAFAGQAAYNAQFPGCVWLNGDTNCDGTVDFFDIDPFVTCLGGNCSCP